MSEPTQKCEKNAIFNQNYAQKLLLLLKWPILAVLAKGEISIFQISCKKSFITSTTDVGIKSSPNTANCCTKSRHSSFCQQILLFK